MELPLEDFQRVLEDLLEVSLALSNQAELLLHRTADGGQHQLSICLTHKNRHKQCKERSAWDNIGGST